MYYKEERGYVLFAFIFPEACIIPGAPQVFN